MDNISDILGSLSQQDIESLKQTAAEIFSQNSDCTNDADSDSSFNLSAENIAKISQIMNLFNQKDSRCELINALKPNLSEKRRRRADEAMQLIRLLDILPMIEKLK